MATRIRVYPQNGLMANNLNGMGAVSAQTFYNQKLQSQQQVSNLRLQYERALFDQKLDNVRLEERLKNPYAAMVNGFGGAMALPGAMMPGVNAFGAAPFGMPTGAQLGIPLGMPLMNPLGMGQMGLGVGAGSGQTNVTNQSGAGGQSVTNSNNVTSMHQNPYYGGFGRFGGGGFLSSLLGALI